MAELGGDRGDNGATGCLPIPPRSRKKDRLTVNNSGCAAFDIRQTREALQRASVPVRRFVACGPLAQVPQRMQIYADVLGEKIVVTRCEFPAALGAAILGCLAAGPGVTRHPAISTAIHAMTAEQETLVYRPDLPAKKAYAKLQDIG